MHTFYNNISSNVSLSSGTSWAKTKIMKGLKHEIVLNSVKSLVEKSRVHQSKLPLFTSHRMGNVTVREIKVSV